jgi:hypothetical protein
VREREEERRRGKCNDAKRAFKNRLDSGREWEETANTCTVQYIADSRHGKTRQGLPWPIIAAWI